MLISRKDSGTLRYSICTFKSIPYLPPLVCSMSGMYILEFRRALACNHKIRIKDANEVDIALPQSVGMARSYL